ncbi:MAG: dihydroxy-acid dehydratase [Proteobacteria bacterium]|nr:dihydroxy-acid dehydratase [Pseudomonadota bacterium]
MSDDKKNKTMRSQAWFGGRRNWYVRCWTRNMGPPDDAFSGKPVIAICNTWSEYSPCNGHLDQIAKHVKQGVSEAGGFPMELPVMSLGENHMRPSTMMFRNLAAMETEELLRANPVDGAVLLVGCDKTTPALMMGAASVDLPTLTFSGGPMLNGHFRGMKIGSGTHAFKFGEMIRAGEMDPEDMEEVEVAMTRSHGSCNTMGTASTMACFVESLGAGLPENGAIPAVDARRYRLANMAGRSIVDMVHKDMKMSKVLTKKSFENAIMVNSAISGSTNAVIHSIAIARRLGIDLTIDDWDKWGKDIPCLVNIMPAGDHLMEDFYYAGGLPVVMERLGDRLHLDALTVNGKTLGENIEGAKCWNDDVIKTMDKPFKPEGGIAVLRGNLAPDGAVLKPAAASPELMKHRGRAVVFENSDEMYSRVGDDSLDVDADCVLVLKNCGPKGYPGMPEFGNMPIPKKLLKQGVTDMVRVSDARMSGTAYGTVVLHAAPEAAVGGNLALVQNGDMIELDVRAGILRMDVSDEELERRRAKWTPPPISHERGYASLFAQHVTQADVGADFDFLEGGSGGVPTKN